MLRRCFLVMRRGDDPLRRMHRSALLVPACRCASSTGGAWLCGCGFNNFGFRGVCFQCNCLKPVPAAVGRLAGQYQPAASDGNLPNNNSDLSSTAGFKPGDWICGCGTHNFARRQACLVCSTPRNRSPQGSPDTIAGRKPTLRTVPFRPGDWHCPRCRTHNFRSRRKCVQCGTQRPTSTRMPAEAPHSVATSSWVCTQCHTANDIAALRCETCGSVREAATPVCEQETPACATPSPPRSDWKCAECGYVNFATRTACKRCVALAVGETPRESFWTCTCGYRNTTSCRDCRECGGSERL